MTEFTANGKTVKVDVPSETRLLWVLREHLGLTGTKYGCGVGLCGACTVHVNGEPRFSCQTYLSDIEGQNVTTIEGLAGEKRHPLQEAWIAEGVPQCGYCQSGQIMRAAALLETNSAPDRAEILEFMSSNLCRCGTYNHIVKAVQRAAKEA